ncbi:MAG: hypothetical protein KDA92_14205 [Planctomycetales bacterium]|nr:hypothetical protein [Planctomycetales bacterium]MCA9167535.1 hypothetical protein [Planctomycetales bacterium]
MKDVILALPGILLTILCWGMYGPVLHKGQFALGNDRLKPLLCVGLAYFIVAVIIPVIILMSNGKLMTGWNAKGLTWSMAAGTAGAVGALGIVLAFFSGGKPQFVMPLVFAGAPLVSASLSMYFAGVTPADAGPKLPFFLAGTIMIGIGAFMVLFFSPKGKHSTPSHSDKPTTHAAAPLDPAPTPASQDTPATAPTETPEEK